MSLVIAFNSRVISEIGHLLIDTKSETPRSLYRTLSHDTDTLCNSPHPASNRQCTASQLSLKNQYLGCPAYIFLKKLKIVYSEVCPSIQIHIL